MGIQPRGQERGRVGSRTRPFLLPGFPRRPLTSSSVNRSSQGLSLLDKTSHTRYLSYLQTLILTLPRLALAIFSPYYSRSALLREVSVAKGTTPIPPKRRERTADEGR